MNGIRFARARAANSGELAVARGGMAKTGNQDIRFRVMRALEADPWLSQGEPSKSLNISPGVVN